MKYAFMSFSTPELKLAEMCELAKRYGYDGVEPRLDAGHTHGVEVGATSAQRAALRAQVDAAGVRLVCLATSLSYADEAKTESMLAQTHERIDLAGDLGVPCVRVFGGKIPDGVSREQAVTLVAMSLAHVAAHAEKRGVTLCLETHDDWCDPAHVAAVMTRVNRASVGVNWDIMHPVRTGRATIDQAFQTLAAWIRHCHIHDGVIGANKDVNLVPIGTGDIDHHGALACLMRAQYRGYLSGEWINWEAAELHLPRELAAMKRYEVELR